VPEDGVAASPTENSNTGDYTIPATHSAEWTLSQQTEEEIIETDMNVVLHAVEFGPKEL